MALRFTINRFPRDAATRDVTGLPWGAVVQPFVGLDQDPASSGQSQQGAAGGSSATPSKGGAGAPLPPLRQVLTPSDDVARCEECFAYINPYCIVDGFLWRCSLCGVVNTFSQKQRHRYADTAASTARESCEELSNSIVEFDIASEAILASDALLPPPGVASPNHSVPNGHSTTAGAGAGLVGWEVVIPEEDLRKLPAYVAVVDVAGSEELLELTKSSLLAALEALPPCALFGLATFSDTVSPSHWCPMPYSRHTVATLKLSLFRTYWLEPRLFPPCALFE